MRRRASLCASSSPQSRAEKKSAKSCEGATSAGANSVLVLLKISVAAVFCAGIASLRGAAPVVVFFSAMEAERVTRLRGCGFAGCSERTNCAAKGARKAEGSW